MSNAYIQFKSRLYREDNESLRLVKLLIKNLSFQQELLSFWNQIPEKSPKNEAPYQQVHQIFICIFKTFFCLSDDSLKLLANEYLQSSSQCDDYIAYEEFSTALTLFVFLSIEFPDLSSSIKFLQMLHSRIYRIQYTKDEITHTVDYKIEVEFYSQDNIEYTLRADQRFKKSFFPIYYEERFINNQVNCPLTIVEYRLSPIDQIIPLGFSAESVVTILQNNNYNIVNFNHISSSNYNYAQKIKLSAITPSSFLSGLPNAQLVPDIGLYSTITNNSDNYGEYLAYYRLNRLYIRNIQWSQYPTQNKLGQKLITNILSEFFTEDDYNVDQINKVNKKWERKLVSAKRQILTTQLQIFDIKSSNPDKRPQKNVAQLLRTLLGDLNQVKDQDKISDAINNLLNLTKNIDLPKFHNYLSKFLSTKTKLPFDTKNPYVDDIIQYANQAPQQILLIGKPRSGRTTFAKALAIKLDLEFIDLERGINRILAKVNENEQNPQIDEEGNPKEFLTELEREVYDNIRFGRNTRPETIESILNLELQMDGPKNKGFILDLPIENSFWVNSILGNKLQLPKLDCRYFTHTILLKQDDEDVKLFGRKIMEKQDDLVITSQFDREEQKRPKIKYRDPNDPDQEEDEEPQDEEKPPIVEEKDLFYRPQDMGCLDESLISFSKQEKKLLQIYQHLPDSQVIEIIAAGLSVQQLVDISSGRVLQGQPLRPLAIKLEGSNEKDLLSVNLTEERMFRMWSQWQLTDPVELILKEKVIQGKVEFACEYAGRVFVFDNEDNQNKFLSYPRKYLKIQPELPKSYIISVQGPRGSGKNTVANQLSQHYGWKLVDVEDIVRNKIIAQLEQEKQKHLQSTFDPRINDIHLTETDWKEFLKGNTVKDILPMVLHYLQVPLQRKPQGWGEPKKEEEEIPPEEEEERKKKEAQKAKAKKKKEEVPQEDIEQTRPVTPPPEDIPTKEIIPLLDAEFKVPETSKPKGIILVGYPQTQEQIDQLNLFGIKIDKIILLTDKSEEPGQILLQRNIDLNYEQESQLVTQSTTIIKEAYGEDNIKEIGIEGTKEDVWNRVRIALDPFYIKADDESIVRVPSDVQEGEDPLVFGDCANYCPVTLQTTNWLVPGKEEFFAMVRGRVYRFYGEKEQQQFKDNVHPYISNFPIPPPRIMIIGIRGCGLRTQLKMLNKQLRLPILDLKENMLQNLQIHKVNRQQNRYFNKGFKPKELDAEGKEIEDPEIVEDPSDFDRKAHEIEVLNKILNCEGVLINGNFFDVAEEQMSTPIVDLMVEAKKLPEIVILIKIEADNFIARNFDTKTIQHEYETKMEELKQKRYQERVEAQQKAMEERAAAEDPETIEIPSLDAPAGEEEDPEAPKLDEMLKEQRDKLLQQHEGDLSKLEDLMRQFEELKIPVKMISSDTTVECVNERLHFEVDPIVDVENRQNLIEKWQTYKLNPYPDPENFKLNKLVLYEKSYTHQMSKFKDRNPTTLQNVPHQVDYPILYRNRIYYLDSEDERELVCNKPLKYLYNKTVPNDVQIKPMIFVLGKFKSGKTPISKMLSQKLNLIRIKISSLLEEFITNQRDILSNKIRQQMQEGLAVEDDLLIQLLMKRIQLDDVYQNGCIIDGFPRTIEQAQKLSQNSLIPTAVLICDKDSFEILNNNQDQNKFGGINTILHQRLQKDTTHLLGYYYEHTFNNVRYLQVGQISNWGVINLCTKFIQSLLYQRAQLARSLITQEPVRVSALTLSKEQIIDQLSPLLNYCPVLLKANKNFIASNLRSLFLLFYDNYLYLLSSEDAEQDFIKNPNNYSENTLSNYKVPLPIIIGMKIDQQNEFKGHCPVELLNNRQIKGQSHLLLNYKNLQFTFSNAKNMLLFENNPKQYKHAKLPDKIHLSDQNNLKNIAKKVAKRGDCTSYLELHLKNIIIRVLAQLGYQRLKYPTLTCKETVLKFIAISLKANNNNKDILYRQKYQQKLDKFLQHCAFPEDITQMRIEDEIDQETLFEKVEVFDEFMKQLQSTQKQVYFQQFIK